MFSTYDEAVDFAMNIPKFVENFDISKSKAFLERIGDVSLRIPTIHIAGTNGKGSVCAYLCAGLNNAGLSCGRFTSPHLVDIRERFMVNDQMIDKREFMNVCNYIYDEVMNFRDEEGMAGFTPNFSEFLFFVAVVWFKTKRPDVLVLETGMGGRLDATNLISGPDVTVITEIGLDHMEYLGDTKDLIALEKAGIIKENVPLVAADRNESWTKVIEEAARQKNAPFETVNASNINNYERTSEGIDFSYSYRYDKNAIFSIKTHAEYQVENVLLAHGAVLYLKNKLDLNIDTDSVLNGYENMKWPGRMEEIAPGIILDGAHNVDGIEAFIKSVREDGKKSRSLMFSAVSDKQVEEVTARLIDSGLFRNFFVAHLNNKRACDMDRLKECFKNVGSVSFYDSTKEAFDALKQDESDIRYVAGSLYLAGEVKAI